MVRPWWWSCYPIPSSTFGVLWRGVATGQTRGGQPEKVSGTDWGLADVRNLKSSTRCLLFTLQVQRRIFCGEIQKSYISPINTCDERRGGVPCGIPIANSTRVVVLWWQCGWILLVVYKNRNVMEISESQWMLICLLLNIVRGHMYEYRDFGSYRNELGINGYGDNLFEPRRVRPIEARCY